MGRLELRVGLCMAYLNGRVSQPCPTNTTWRTSSPEASTALSSAASRTRVETAAASASAADEAADPRDGGAGSVEVRTVEWPASPKTTAAQGSSKSLSGLRDSCARSAASCRPRLSGGVSADPAGAHVHRWTAAARHGALAALRLQAADCADLGSIL